MKIGLDLEMAEEERKINAMLENKRDEVMAQKKKNLQDRINLAAGDLSAEQIKNLKKIYEREFDQLENAIREEKTKQLNNMRSKIMQRRVDKERKKREAQRKADEDARRKQIENMDQGMVRQFTKLQTMRKAMEKKVNTESKAQTDLYEKLKQMLKEWQRNVENS